MHWLYVYLLDENACSVRIVQAPGDGGWRHHQTGEFPIRTIAAYGRIVSTVFDNEFGYGFSRRQ